MKLPWNEGDLKDWSIGCMNHYHDAADGRWLFVLMTLGNRCIKAEGMDEEEVFEKLQCLAYEARLSGEIEEYLAIVSHEKNGHTSHCARRLVWGDGECECKNGNGRATDAVVALDGKELLKTLNRDLCLDCGAVHAMLAGPRGGFSTNIRCSKCGSTFNICLPCFAERI